MKEAKKAYDSAPNDQKPELLLRMVEAEAKILPQEYYRQLGAEFGAAKQAYLKLLLAEPKNTPDP